jgi:hypothetical protein
MAASTTTTERKGAGCLPRAFAPQSLAGYYPSPDWRFSAMVHVGDEVVVMSAAGRFTVVAIEGAVLTIESAQGVRKTVLEPSVRTVEKRDQSPA